MTQPVCLVIGAGAGIGGHVAQRFARECCHARLARRSDSEGLARPADDLFINFDDGSTKAGLPALRVLSQRPQMIFLSHHDHLLAMVREVYGAGMNVTVFTA